MSFDLVLKNGRILDSGRGLDLAGDIAFAGGRVAAIGAGLVGGTVRDVGGALVVPGLIDLHTHVYRDATPLSVDADLLLRRSGTTTSVDAGSAGAGGIRGLFSLVAPRTTARILAFVNIGHAGILASGSACVMPEAEDMRLLNVRACAAAVREQGANVVGVKVRVGASSTGRSGVAPLHMAIRAAEMAAGGEGFVPVMVHIGADMPPSIDALLEALRPGDILTHCCSPKVNSVLGPGGRLRASAIAAKRRGVVFDIAHGAGSFGFDTARRMLDQGMVPDVISSDVHTGCVDGPAFDVLVTMTKLLAMGMALPEVIRRATAAPAAAIARPGLGTLAEGGIGDATVLALHTEKLVLQDSIGATMMADRQLRLEGVVAGGRWVVAPQT